MCADLEALEDSCSRAGSTDSVALFVMPFYDNRVPSGGGAGAFDASVIGWGPMHWGASSASGDRRPGRGRWATGPRAPSTTLAVDVVVVPAFPGLGHGFHDGAGGPRHPSSGC